MRGPQILAASLSVATPGNPRGKPFQYGNSWQYHPRSDRHSKIACWGLIFDLLTECPPLREHVKAGKVAIGINHPMQDFAQNRRKNLDLVVCRGERSEASGPVRTFADLIAPYTIVLRDEDRRDLAQLPSVPLARPRTVLVALEAKACMTEFAKARPRLYDELNSSHLTIHGDTDGAIAAAFAMVNLASSFVSPLRNPWPLGSRETIVSRYKQPSSAAGVVEKLEQLPRRSRQGEEGFDALAIVLLACANDGSPVALVETAPAPGPDDIFDYGQCVRRIAHLYATRFSGI